MCSAVSKTWPRQATPAGQLAAIAQLWIIFAAQHCTATKCAEIAKMQNVFSLSPSCKTLSELCKSAFMTLTTS